jgi:hypothetical protein
VPGRNRGPQGRRLTLEFSLQRQVRLKKGKAGFTFEVVPLEFIPLGLSQLIQQVPLGGVLPLNNVAAHACHS